jgi:acetyl-CoA synthetase
LVAAYKYPREIEFVSELPKTTSGKTRHIDLRQASMRNPAAATNQRDGSVLERSFNWPSA